MIQPYLFNFSRSRTQLNSTVVKKTSHRPMPRSRTEPNSTQVNCPVELNHIVWPCFRRYGGPRKTGAGHTGCSYLSLMSFCTNKENTSLFSIKHSILVLTSYLPYVASQLPNLHLSHNTSQRYLSKCVYSLSPGSVC